MISPPILMAKAKRKAKQGYLLARRNRYNTHAKPVQRRRVNLEWVSNGNLGDELAPHLYRWMLDRKGIQETQKTRKTYHLMTVGSMMGSWNFDAVVWGSGVHVFRNIQKLYQLRHVQKFDVRAVRGPITRAALKASGHDCPEVYGDPAVLMPLIHMPDKPQKQYETSIVLHYHAADQWKQELMGHPVLHPLEIGTVDYHTYLQEMLASERIISSSLHGIILAEAYGIPAVFLNTGGYVDQALMKYYDWYYATGRYNVTMARSLEEAVQMEPMPLPDLAPMRRDLLESFPYDLWT